MSGDFAHHRVAWREKLAEWLAGWLGTTAAGGLFGSGVGLLAAPGLDGVGLGFVVGVTLAGGSGLLLMPTIAALVWICWLDRRRNASVVVFAGGFTGFLCGFLLGPLCALSAATGAAGAAVGVQLLRSRPPQSVWKMFVLPPREPPGPETSRLRFTTRDLLLRMTVIAILIAVWSALLRRWF